MKKVITLAVAGICAASVPAMAQTTGNSAGIGAQVYNFTTLDTDRNGSLTLSELNAGGMADARAFGRIDVNRDGIVSSTELNSFNTSSAANTTPTTMTPSSQSTTPTTNAVPSPKPYVESNPAIRGGAGRPNSLSQSNAVTTSNIAPAAGSVGLSTNARVGVGASATSPSTSSNSSGSISSGAGVSGSAGASAGGSAGGSN